MWTSTEQSCIQHVDSSSLELGWVRELRVSRFLGKWVLGAPGKFEATTNADWARTFIGQASARRVTNVTECHHGVTDALETRPGIGPVRIECEQKALEKHCYSGAAGMRK